MIYKIFNSSPGCDRVIEKFIFIQTESPKEIYKDKFVPDGRLSFVFNFSGQVYLTDTSGRKPLPNFFISLPIMKSLRIEVIHPTETMVAVCKATAATKSLNIKLERETEKEYLEANPFEKCSLLTDLKQAREMTEKIKIFESFMKKNYSIDNYFQDDVDLAYEKILASGGLLELSDIILSAKTNPRSLRRKFRERAGISAKSLQRIARVNYVWQTVKNNPTSGFQNVIYECKFWDQAHFIHDFKKIMGESPKAFFSRDHKHLEIISGKPLTSS